MPLLSIFDAGDDLPPSERTRLAACAVPAAARPTLRMQMQPLVPHGGGCLERGGLLISASNFQHPPGSAAAQTGAARPPVHPTFLHHHPLPLT